MHIGKTGGTAIRHALKGFENSSRFELVMHSHPTTLDHIPKGERFTYFLRDPISRFKSGFLSRQRKGQPRYNVPWTESEQKAFNVFSKPSELALALRSESSDLKLEAERAMKGINHVRFRYADWFLSRDNLLARKSDLFFVGFQESLEADFTQLVAKLELPTDLRLPRNEKDSHRTPKSLECTLNNQAAENLRDYFSEDYMYYDLSKCLAEEVNSTC